MAIPTRKEWQKIRDAAGGKAGETKKVSVGKALDEYHKAAAKYSGDELLKPLQELERDLITYCEAVKSTNPKLRTAVQDELLAEITKEKRQAKEVSGLADNIEELVKEIEKLMKKDDWVDEREKIADKFLSIRSCAEKLADVDPDDRWAQIHRMTVLACNDIEKGGRSFRFGDRSKFEEAEKQAEGTIEDALKAIKRHVK